LALNFTFGGFVKIVFTLIILTSSLAFAEDSCIKIQSEANGLTLICDESDGPKVSALKCDVKSNKCFTGSAAKIVSKINTGLINDGDAYIALGIRLSENAVQFQYGDSIAYCKVVVNRCF